MVKKFGASMGCPRCHNGTGTQTHACRARKLSSMAAQTSVASQAPTVDVAVDRQGPGREAKRRGHEDRGRDVVMGTADEQQQQPAGTE